MTPYIPSSVFTSLPSGIWSGVFGLPVFPWLPGQAPEVEKSSNWATEISKSASGRRRATSYYPYPLWDFSISYNVLRRAPTATIDEVLALFEFFNTAKGPGLPWLFVDPSENQILSTAPQNFGVGDGARTQFQLARSINLWVEPVYDAYTPTILDNGAAAGAHTIVPNGVVSFSVAPLAGHVLSWYGYYYFGCAFLDDKLNIKKIARTLWSGDTLNFESLRP